MGQCCGRHKGGYYSTHGSTGGGNLPRPKWATPYEPSRSTKWPVGAGGYDIHAPNASPNGIPRAKWPSVGDDGHIQNTGTNESSPAYPHGSAQWQNNPAGGASQADDLKVDNQATQSVGPSTPAAAPTTNSQPATIPSGIVIT